MDLSQLSDEQLSAYRDLLAKKNMVQNPPGIKNPVNADTFGKPNPIEKFSGEHPYIAATAGVLSPTAAALTGTGTDIGKGALKTLGRDAYESLSTAGPVGMLAHYAGEKAGLGGKLRMATEPSNPAQRVGGIATNIAEAALPLPEVLPSTARAAQNFELAKSIAKDVPVDVSKFAEPVMKARELHIDTRDPYPPILRKAFGDIGPTTEPLTYGQARNMAVSAGKQAQKEAMAPRTLTSAMKKQLKPFGTGLDEATSEAAHSVGVGDIHDQAMREWRNAMRMQAAARALGKAAITGGAAYGGYHAAKPLLLRAIGD